MTKTTILTRICKECGRPFPGGPRAWYCPDCRQERKRKHDKEFKERKRSGKVIPNGSIIKCEICGKEIVKNGGLQRFCDECSAKHLKEIDNKQSLKWKNENPEKIKESKRKISKKRHKNEKSIKSGVKGVSWDKGSQKWVANINYNGKQYRIIRTHDKNVAVQSRKEAEAMNITCIDDIYQLREKYKNILHKINPEES